MEVKNNFTLFDFGGNIERFGNYEDERIWSLWHEETKKGSGVPPLKLCGYDTNNAPLKPGGDVKKGCMRLIPVSSDICPFCGFKAYKPTTKEIVELQLAQIKDENGVSLKFKTFKDMSYDELKQYQEIKGHTAGWLWRQLYLKNGASEIYSYGKYHKWNDKTINKAVNFCHQKFK